MLHPTALYKLTLYLRSTTILATLIPIVTYSIIIASASTDSISTSYTAITTLPLIASSTILLWNTTTLLLLLKQRIASTSLALLIGDMFMVPIGTAMCVVTVAIWWYDGQYAWVFEVGGFGGEMWAGVAGLVVAVLIEVALIVVDCLARKRAAKERKVMVMREEMEGASTLGGDGESMEGLKDGSEWGDDIKVKVLSSEMEILKE